MIAYHRTSFTEEDYDRTREHVCQHISSIASATDDPNEFENQVQIQTSTNEDGSTRIYGQLDREPTCDYSLPEEFEYPQEDEYQKGFGERNMTPEELQEHMLRKAGLA